MANDALNLNPPNAAEHITTHGSDWLWAAFSVFALSLLVTIVLNFVVRDITLYFPPLIDFIRVQRPRGTRVFHEIAIVILTVSSLAYFSMASDLGATPVTAEFRDRESRQIWVRLVCAS